MNGHNVKFPPMPLFRLTGEVMDTLTEEEISETLKAMVECGIFATPFRQFAVEIKNLEKIYANNKDIENADILDVVPECKYTLYYQFNDVKFQEFTCITQIKYTNGQTILAVPRYMPPGSYEIIQKMENYVVACLVALLATRNAEKKTIENDVRSKNHQSREDAKRKFTSTTVIKIGAITETLEGHGNSGRRTRPHLRRGHVRNQRHGEGRMEVKKVFIAPVFVNADRGWVDTDKVYKVVA
jgi:hypothetical protein